MNDPWILRGATAPALCLALLFGGFIVDLNTDQDLVVAIIYNIPIAISGALLSRRLTTSVLGLSLASNAAAAYANAVHAGGLDGTVLANRILAGLSFLLVGGLTLLFEETSEEVAELVDAEDTGARERELRALLVELSAGADPTSLMEEAVRGLRRLLDADAVVAVGLDGDRFAAPRWAAPAFCDVAEIGKLASWAVDALPVTAVPVITVRGEEGVTSVGRWRSDVGQDLLVVAHRPSRRQASALLGDALGGLEVLRDRALRDVAADIEWDSVRDTVDVAADVGGQDTVDGAADVGGDDTVDDGTGGQSRAT